MKYCREQLSFSECEKRTKFLDMGRNMGTGKVEKEMVKELKKMPEEKASKGSNITNLLLDSK